LAHWSRGEEQASGKETHPSRDLSGDFHLDPVNLSAIDGDSSYAQVTLEVANWERGFRCK
jgi:hypothetical protein